MATFDSDDPRTPVARQGGGSLRTIPFIAVIALGVAAIFLMAFGWSGTP